MVEAGASSFYQALEEAANEPVLKEICGRISIDGMRHYKIFRQRISFYENQEGVGLLRKLKAALQRSFEVDDAELSFSYFAANSNDPLKKEKLPKYASRYMNEIRHLYQSKHWRRVISLTANAINLPQKQRVSRVIGQGLYYYSQIKKSLSFRESPKTPTD